MLEDMFGVLIVGYIVISVIAAIIKRAQHHGAGPPRNEDWVRPPVGEPTVITVETMLEEELSPDVMATVRGEDEATTAAEQKDPVRAAEPNPFDHMMWEGDVETVRAVAAAYRHPGASTPMKSSVRNTMKQKHSVRQAILLAEVLGPPRAKRKTHRLP